jgi:hypothetical protein
MELGFWLEHFGIQRMRRRSQSWPSTKAWVESAFVSIIPTRQTRWALEVAYAYRVNGEVYGNTERRFFLNGEEPRKLEQTLRETGVAVRYDPARPAQCFMELSGAPDK